MSILTAVNTACLLIFLAKTSNYPTLRYQPFQVTSRYPKRTTSQPLTALVNFKLVQGGWISQ